MEQENVLESLRQLPGGTVIVFAKILPGLQDFLTLDITIAVKIREILR